MTQEFQTEGYDVIYIFKNITGFAGGMGYGEAGVARMRPEKQQYRQEATVAFNWQLAHSHSRCSDILDRSNIGENH